jgi:hypothetical protein
MLILFDWENIQAAHYKTVRELISLEFGHWVWADAVKVGAIAEGNEKTCNPDWIPFVKTYLVPNAPQAADNKLIEIATKHRGNRCIIISGDRALVRKIHQARITARTNYGISKRGLQKTKTFCVRFDENKNLTISSLPYC